MKLKQGLLLLGVLASLPAPASAETTFPIPLGTNSVYHGYIDTGSNFGVRVGDSLEHAKQVLLEMGLRDDGVFGCERYVAETVACRPGDLAEIFRIRRFMYDGDVFVFVENGKVSAISWSAKLIYVDV